MSGRLARMADASADMAVEFIEGTSYAATAYKDSMARLAGKAGTFRRLGEFDDQQKEQIAKDEIAQNNLERAARLKKRAEAFAAAS